MEINFTKKNDPLDGKVVLLSHHNKGMSDMYQ